MMKRKSLVFAALLMLAFGCGKAEQERLTVYSFSGENEQIAVSNGVIVLSDTEEIFAGGSLEVNDDCLTDIASYSTTFYILSDGQKNIICSDRIENKTEETGVLVSDDLGKLTGEDIVSSAAGDNDALKNNLYFELTATDQNGMETVYRLPLSLTEITSD